MSVSVILITGGLVSVEDGAKHDPADQYSLSRKVRVELKFDVAEGSEPKDVLALVGDMANDQVSAMLGRSPSTARVVTATTGTEAAPAARKRRTKEEIAADATAAAAAEAALKKADPLAMEDEPSPPADAATPAAATTSDQAGSSGVAATSAEAALDDWDAPAATPTVAVSDGDLSDAVTKKNGELGDPVPIRNLIGSFNPDPTKAFNLRQIAPEQRQAFLDKLAALVKPA